MRDLEGIMCFGIGPSISWLVAGLPIPHLRYFQRLDGSSKGHGNTGRPNCPKRGGRPKFPLQVGQTGPSIRKIGPCLVGQSGRLKPRYACLHGGLEISVAGTM